MTGERWLIAAAIFAIALANFFLFPGRTVLQSDTQIYLPMLLHADQPSVLRNDFMTVRPHLSFTLYDEAVIALHRATKLDMENVLAILQFLCRTFGIVGLYLLASSTGLAPPAALAVAALASLGTAVMGPAVLTVEYEPIPRGFALPFGWLSLGLAAIGRLPLAAAAISVGVCFHAPTVLPFFALLLILFIIRQAYSALTLLFAGPAALLLASLGQPAVAQPGLFSVLDPSWENIQRTRAAYNWVSSWFTAWGSHYALVTVIFSVAWWRTRQLFPRGIQWIVLSLSLIGIASVGLSYLFLDLAKWTLIPQAQPGRYLLFLTFFAVFLSAVAALHAAQKGHYLESMFFLLIPLVVPLEYNLTTVLPPLAPLSWRRLLAAVAAAAVLSFLFRYRRLMVPASLACFFLLPICAQIRNYPSLHSGNLRRLSDWARENTPPDAVFQFADFHRRLEPGIFRTRARRALYVDWKAGGQVNFTREFAFLWKSRWDQVSTPGFHWTSLKQRDVDYLVFPSDRCPLPASSIVYRNDAYAVISLR